MSPLARTAGFASLWTARPLLDDRGRRVAALRPRRAAPPFVGSVMPADVRRAVLIDCGVRAGVRGQGIAKYLVLCMCGVGVGVLGWGPITLAMWYGMPALFRRTSGVPTFVGISVVTGVFALTAAVQIILMTPLVQWFWAPVYAGALIRSRYCASCAYPLAPAAPEADGCTVCSECGAAWRLPATPADTTGGRAARAARPPVR
ncbi:MAG TPA: hypothetical protein PKE29_03810 [Phycisphaerales bacterium]|nr:hypothetical protein [Phycisphaerales bacterium]